MCVCVLFGGTVFATNSRLRRAMELAQALEYMHGGSGMGAMMHRDIKSVSALAGGERKLVLFPVRLSRGRWRWQPLQNDRRGIVARRLAVLYVFAASSFLGLQ